MQNNLQNIRYITDLFDFICFGLKYKNHLATLFWFDFGLESPLIGKYIVIYFVVKSLVEVRHRLT